MTKREFIISYNFIVRDFMGPAFLCLAPWDCLKGHGQCYRTLGRGVPGLDGLKVYRVYQFMKANPSTIGSIHFHTFHFHHPRDGSGRGPRTWNTNYTELSGWITIISLYVTLN